MIVELACANLGIVKRDYDAKADTQSLFGNHRYRGTVDETGHWCISDCTPTLTAQNLSSAIACGSLVPNNGPWTVTDRSEAYAVLMQWLLSREANINPAAVKHFIALRDLTFHTDDAGMVRRFYGLALGYFRHRLAGGPFQWPEPGPSSHPREQLEEVARAVAGIS